MALLMSWNHWNANLRAVGAACGRANCRASLEWWRGEEPSSQGKPPRIARLGAASVSSNWKSYGGGRMAVQTWALIWKDAFGSLALYAKQSTAPQSSPFLFIWQLDLLKSLSSSMDVGMLAAELFWKISCCHRLLPLFLCGFYVS